MSQKSSQRLTVYVSDEWRIALETMAMMKRVDLSDMFASIVQSHFATLPQNESGLIRDMVEAVTGNALPDA